MMTEDSPFAVLGVTPSASDREIRSAYFVALRQHPPESDPEGFKRVRKAYEALKDQRGRLKAQLFGSLVLPEVPPWEELLGDVRNSLALPNPADLRQSLRRVALLGSDFLRQDFRKDFHNPNEGPGKGTGHG